MQAPKRKRYQKDSTHTDDILTLIHLVRQNPALYNYKLQPNQRRRIDVLNGWAQIAAEIGNKYTVEECRRKWKNLRDTYHQYRLRKPRLSDGLSKWRYAKELDFLSNVYQPKLKSNRQQNYDIKPLCLHGVHEAAGGRDEDDPHNHLVHSSIALVNDDAETFILTSYEESVTDDGTGGHIVDHSGHMELTHGDDGVEMIKNEHASSMDDDAATGAEVDYEEVCLYEEAGSVSETIIGGGGGGGGCGGVVDRRSHHTTDSKAFQYIDANDFCIETINANSHLSSGSGGNVLSGIKLKMANDQVGVNSASSSAFGGAVAGQLSGGLASLGQAREELDLFFDFLKKKIQRFSKQDVTAIQIEFLNCVLRREAEMGHKSSASSVGVVGAAGATTRN